VWKDHEGYQALPVHLGLLVPRALQDQVVKKAEGEQLDPRENEAAEDSQDPPDLQARLVNQQEVKQVPVTVVS